jgi:uncharacterized membrane protein
MHINREIASARLDAFVDAAFAFAVTLLVIGGGEPPQSYGELEAVMRRVPAFLVGFALLGMFWHGHVRWRRACGNGNFVAVMLSFALVFLVLVYVYPLRMMADSMVTYFSGGKPTLSYADLPGLFTLYGLGFGSMAALVAALFATGLKTAEPEQQATVRAERGIWLILAGSGALSVLMAQFRITAPFAPWVYAMLPIPIGLFNWWFAKAEARREGAVQAEAA